MGTQDMLQILEMSSSNSGVDFFYPDRQQSLVYFGSDLLLTSNSIVITKVCLLKRFVYLVVQNIGVCFEAQA